jgi:hypothetical protein
LLIDANPELHQIIWQHVSAEPGIAEGDVVPE